MINREIDKKLLIESGYKINESQDYIIKPLRRFADRFDDSVLSVIVKTKSKDVVLHYDDRQKIKKKIN